MSYSELLRGTDIFAKLTDDELEAVARCVEERQAKPDTVLIEEGETGDALFLLQSGKVAVEKKINERTVRLAELTDGAVFGEMALIDNVPTSATVFAVDESSLLVISRADLNVLLNWDTVLASKMWRSFTEMLCHRVRAVNDKLLSHYGDDAREEYATATGVFAPAASSASSAS